MMEKTHKYMPTPLSLLAFLISFIVIYSVGNPILQDSDMGWHIAAGDLIRANWSVPKKDAWSFLDVGQPWYNISWLWDVILSLVNQMFGLKGLFIFTVSCPALLVAILLNSIRSRGNVGVNALIFTGMITTYCMLEFATGRPQIAGLFFALIFHHLLHKSREDNKSRALFFLPLITILWANIHGSFFAGWAIIGAYGLEALFNKNKTWFLHLLLIGILCVAAIFINPYGLDIITAVMRTMNSVVSQYITEWHPFVFGAVIGPSLWLLVFILMGNLRAGKIPLADKILAVIWLLAMFFSIRNIGLLSILGAPYIALSLPPDNLKEKNTRNLLKWINNMRLSPYLAVAIPVTMVIAYSLLTLLGPAHYIEKPEKSFMPAVNYVMQHYAGKRVFNDYDYGGRIIYETKGTLPVFIDGRAGTSYNEKILKDMLDIVKLEKGWQDIIDSYDIDIIMLGNGRDFVKDYGKGLYHDKWDEVFRDEVSSVYVRKN